MTPRAALSIAAALCAAWVTSCSSDPVDPPAATTGGPPATGPRASEDVVQIESNTQGTFGDVRIGAGNFREEEYTDASGKKVKGWTAMLWISVRDDASQDRAVRVHPGMKLDAGSKSFEVRAVEQRVVTLAHVNAPRP